MKIPARCQRRRLKYRAATGALWPATSSSTLKSRAIEVSTLIDNQTSIRSSAIFPSSEIMDHVERRRRRCLGDNSQRNYQDRQEKRKRQLRMRYENRTLWFIGIRHGFSTFQLRGWSWSEA